jgi:hypothetical protein
MTRQSRTARWGPGSQDKTDRTERSEDDSRIGDQVQDSWDRTDETGEQRQNS